VVAIFYFSLANRTQNTVLSRLKYRVKYC